MAIFHSHLQIITRGIGKFSVGAAAYRSGEKLFNEYDGVTYNYGRKGGIVHKEKENPHAHIMLISKLSEISDNLLY
jgi:hypothetical protein